MELLEKRYDSLLKTSEQLVNKADFGPLADETEQVLNDALAGKYGVDISHEQIADLYWLTANCIMGTYCKETMHTIDFDKMISLLKKAMDIMDKEDYIMDLSNILGTACFIQGEQRGDQELQELNAYIERTGGSAKVYERLAFAWVTNKHNYDKMREYYKIAVKMAPEDTEILWGYYTWIDEAIPKHPEVIADAVYCLETIIRVKTERGVQEDDHIDFRYHELASAYYYWKKYDKALENIQKALSMTEHPFDMLVLTGDIYAKMKNKKEAVRFYEQACEFTYDEERIKDIKKKLFKLKFMFGK